MIPHRYLLERVAQCLQCDVQWTYQPFEPCPVCWRCHSPEYVAYWEQLPFGETSWASSTVAHKVTFE